MISHKMILHPHGRANDTSELSLSKSARRALNSIPFQSARLALFMQTTAVLFGCVIPWKSTIF